ncbi:methyltransferase domain protein [[Clostridium] methylpentosum DSM 5476]|uniref:Methyltransferase domain protein n=1 Tax=[Clostridium] methylpentosum DSM 5476 TaxID=537013 RepID=C0EJ61_9FIRM|nr:methyltransferase domain protein [[Clostridium] methylpentosum DSM 5476]MDY3989705.1 class I SAM-dependent methyltransferase [Massilioclostridium sp.]
MSSYEAFATVYDELTDDISYPNRAAYFDKLVELHGGKRGILLDLACGTGSLSEEFARLGYDVIGVDSSEEMLAAAMNKRVESGFDITYLHQRMQDLDLYGTIDVAVCALDSLNHLTSAKELQRAVDRVSLFLDPQGLFLFDVNTPYKHREVLANNIFVYDYDDVYLVWKNTLLEDDIVSFELDIFEQDGEAYFRTTERFCERAYSKDQLQEVLDRAGLEVVGLYHEDSLEPPLPHSERVVYVTKKKNY